MKAHFHLANFPLPPPPLEDERSERNRKLTFSQNSEQKKLKQSFLDSYSALTETEPEKVSSISDTSPEEEVAITLMLLSRDKWEKKKKNNVVDKEEAQEVERSMRLMEEIKLKKVSGKQKCDKCGNNFGSSRALESHKIICLQNEANLVAATSNSDHKIFQCMICFKVFGSGQALGGHKRSHFYPSLKKKLCFFDLNSPPSPEEDDPVFFYA
jgi:predicted lactoylglutathione lyase